MKQKIFVTALAVTILLAGVIAFSFSRIPARVPLSSGFIINFTFWEDGQLTAVIKRQVKANGEFLEETIYTTGKRTTLAGSEELGAVTVDEFNKRLKYKGGADIAQSVTMEQARQIAGPYYVRDDKLLGYDVVVSERCSENRSHCTTFWEAPELGRNVLRMEESSDGVVHVLREAVAVTRGEPGFTVPNYPVDKSQFEQRKAERGNSSR